jgi:glycosyltransferase involved in cell wall biosynthesis
MKILAFSDVALPEGSGGVERQILEVYGRIVRNHGAEIRLIALGRGGAPREEVRAGILVKRARQLPLDGFTGAQATLSPFVWPMAWNEVRRFRPDVIHANTLFYATTLAAAAVSWRTRTPFVLTAHLGNLDALPQPYRTLSKAYESTVGRSILSRADRVICIGEEVRRHIVKLGVSTERTVSIPNGVDIRQFFPLAKNEHSARSVIKIISVGRLVFNKGNQYVIEAAKRLHATGRSFELSIVGDGPMSQSLERQAEELIGAKVVEFVGRRSDIPQLLRGADIFVRPSLTEAMSLSMLEAMASGLAVIATDVGSTREVLTDGVNGLLVRPGSVDALVDVLAKLIDGVDLRLRLGEAARQTAHGYNWEQVATSTFAVLSSAVGRVG